MKNLTVAKLIEFLQTQPQDMPVAYQCYSEYSALKVDEIGIMELQPARVDGWVHSKRPDKPVLKYLVLPGN